MTDQPLNRISRHLCEALPQVKDEVDRIAREAFPKVRFVDIWVRPDRPRGPGDAPAPPRRIGELTVERDLLSRGLGQ